MNEKQVCCFTGHRNLPEWEKNSMRQKLEAVTREFAAAGIRTYCAGGAVGFDTLAEQVVLELKKEFPQIRLVLVLPCRQQAKYWPERDKAVYQDILRRADELIFHNPLQQLILVLKMIVKGRADNSRFIGYLFDCNLFYRLLDCQLF